MAKEKFEAGVAGTKPVVDKDLNQDGVVDMNEELVAAQAAVESGDVGVAPEVIEALKPVVTEPEVEDEPVVTEPEVEDEPVVTEPEVVQEAEKQEETQSSEEPKEEGEEQPKEVIKASQVVKNNAGSSIQFNLPEVRVVKNNSSFVM
jgi:hypothetical protein